VKNTLCIQVRIPVKNFATLAVFFDKKGIRHIKNASILNAAFQLLVDILEKNGKTEKIETNEAALAVCKTLGITFGKANKLIRRNLAEDIKLDMEKGNDEDSIDMNIQSVLDGYTPEGFTHD